MSLRMRDLQQILDKFTNGNKGTAISDCFIYMETDNGKLAGGWAATPSWDIVYIIGVWRVSDANMSCKS